ncbi:hypothetical protein Trydic_g18257 [Trypoxylus dichotomus]
MALNASWFVRNTMLHEDAGVEPLIDFIRRIVTRSCPRFRITISGSPGGTLGHGHSSWTAEHPEMEPSHFVEDADLLEPKVD